MELKEKRNKPSGSLTRPAQSHPENISATHELNLKKSGCVPMKYIFSARETK